MKTDDTPAPVTPAAVRADGTPFQTASFTDVVEAFERRGEREMLRRAEVDAAARKLLEAVEDVITGYGRNTPAWKRMRRQAIYLKATMEGKPT